MEAKKVNASGRTSASMRVEKYDGGVRLVGGYNSTHSVPDYPYGDLQAADTAPIPTLEVGRRGGGNPPVPRGFYYMLLQWSRDKGISFASDSERRTFAYFLSRKIAREGTQRNKMHIDVYTEAVETARGKITDVFRRDLGNQFRAVLSNWKQ